MSDEVKCIGGVGRPRDIPLEIEILSLCSEGLPVGQVAARTGVHRNTVGNVIKRAKFSPEAIIADAEQQQCLTEIEEIKQERTRLEHKQRFLEYKAAINGLLVFFKAAADAVDRGRAIWLSLDTEFADGFTRHDVVAGSTPTPQEDAERRELANAIDVAMEQLTELQSSVLRLVFWDGKSLSEVADELNIDESQVVEAEAIALELLRDRVA